MNAFAGKFKESRLKLGLTLRQFCEKNGYDPGNISKLERGVFPPPEATEKVEEYAKALGLQRGTDGWIEFVDSAASTRGQIPPDLLADDRIVRRLPILFRTLRGQRVSRQKRKDLVDFIRNAERHGF